MKKIISLAVVAVAASALSGCAGYPDKKGQIHLITESEAAANHCQFLDFAGSASALLINGKKRNTAVIVKKAGYPEILVDDCPGRSKPLSGKSG